MGIRIKVNSFGVIERKDILIGSIKNAGGKWEFKPN